MAGFKDLYDYCQTLEPKISRKDILKKVLEITGVKQVKPVKTSVDKCVGRGMFISASNTEHRIVQQLGCNVIVLARDQKYCWERFVYTKELMHLFDNADQVADTPEKLDAVLSSFQVPNNKNPVTASEHICFWMALACLCPEKHRLMFKEQIEKKHADYYSIALALRIPEQYVPRLFDDHYPDIIEFIVNNN